MQCYDSLRTKNDSAGTSHAIKEKEAFWMLAALELQLCKKSHQDRL